MPDRNLVLLGVFLLIFVLALVIIRGPQPDSPEFWLYRILVALGAASVGSALPGFLNVSLPAGVKAGGGLAIFVIVLLLNPPSLVVKKAELPSTTFPAEKPFYASAPTTELGTNNKERTISPAGKPSSPPLSYLETGTVRFHTNTSHKRGKTIVEVLVTDKTGRVFASLSDTFANFGKNSDAGPYSLQVDNSTLEVAKSAQCRIHINNSKGVTENDVWTFNYALSLNFSKGEKLHCSEMNLRLETAGNQYSDLIPVKNGP
jgi:hypothetical protein